MRFKRDKLSQYHIGVLRYVFICCRYGMDKTKETVSIKNKLFGFLIGIVSQTFLIS